MTVEIIRNEDLGIQSLGSNSHDLLKRVAFFFGGGGQLQNWGGAYDVCKSLINISIYYTSIYIQYVFVYLKIVKVYGD